MRKRRLQISTFAITLSVIGWLTAVPARQAQVQSEGDVFVRTVRPFLARNCYPCHNQNLKSGGLNLEAFQASSSITDNRERFERLVSKLKAGEMPPKGMPRPNPTELKNVVASIEAELNKGEGLVKPDPGKVTARRLNRAEYNNTVRDLLGVDLRPADDFPQDDSGYGFDNIGDVLSLSPVLMERYLSSAEKVSRAAVFGSAEIKPTTKRYRTSSGKIAPSLTPLFDYDTIGLTLPNAIHVTHRFPVDADYIIRAFLGGVRPIGSEPFQLVLWIDGKQVQTAEFDPSKTAAFDDVEAQELGGMVQEFHAPLKAGDHWLAIAIPRLYEGLPPRYNGPSPSKLTPPPPRPFKAPQRLPAAVVEELRKKYEARVAASQRAPVNEVRISALEVGGPYDQKAGPSVTTQRLLFVCGHPNGHHRPGCARKILASLARRAFRRPVTSAEIDRLTSLVSLTQKKGDSFEEGMCQALQAILVSPYFLFRIERGEGTASEDVQPISQYELASRLSYFLWSSMPDDELLSLADRGALSDSQVLAAQVTRMLKDPKSRALVENFGGQWLELRKLESVKPDRQRFPEFDDYLRMSMRLETEDFFESIIRDDRSILDFIDGEYTFLNERLARFYHIDGVKGPEFRKVSLKGQAHRGGILTQASVLTVSSYATRTSPVLRGKWILEKILNAPPPPPPPGVPNLDESKIGSAASLREQLAAHRRNPTCASCHARMDPLGFALENFDAIGAWRTRDGKFQIDASGTLPDGRTFEGVEQLKAILRSDSNAFAECLTEKLLTYALGRGLERYDRPTVKKIVANVAAHDYRFSSLVQEIAASLPFQMRHVEK
jgi:hypothetical protein